MVRYGETEAWLHWQPTFYLQTFMEEMTRKQPDVDKVTKTHKRKAAEPTPIQSQIPVLDKGRGGRK